MSTTDADATQSIQQSLRALRARRRLTQADLARGLGTTVLSVNRWENGQARPSARMLRRIDQFAHPGADEPLTADRNAPPAQALHAGQAAAGNLPRPRADLIGREHELARARRLLPDAPLLTLTGAGGCGKTRLALQLAQSAAADHADGVFLVELAAISDPALLPNAIAGALGVCEETAQPLLDTLVAALRPRRLLLVLDNCEHLIDACAAVAERLLNACPLLHLIATSREPLRITSETVFRLPPLALPAIGVEQAPEEMAAVPAVALFVQRAQMQTPAFHLDAANAPVVARICRRLDGLPLAIELAAARLAVLSAGQLAERLDDRFRLLAGGSRTAPARQQTLRATVAWSYDLLDAAERAFFDRLSVFAGGFTLAAAEFIADLPLAAPEDAIDLLARLVEKSLLDREDRAGTPRYQLLETLREYGRERLTQAGAVLDVLHRHAEYFRELAERAEPELQGADQADWLDQIEAELGNLRSALHWSLATPDTAETGLRLAAAIWRFWLMRGLLREGRTWIEQGLLNRGVRPGVRAGALLAAGKLALHQTDLEPATRQLTEAAALFRELGDTRMLARSLLNLGHVLNRGDPAAGYALYQESLALARTIEAPRDLAEVVTALGSAETYRGNPSAAVPLLEEGAALYQQAGDRYGLGLTLGYLGFSRMLLSDSRAAWAAYRESLALCYELGEKQGTAFFLLGPAVLLLDQGEAYRAAVLFGLSEVLCEQAGTPLYPALRPLHAASVRRMRARLGEAEFAAAWAAGRARNPGDAIAEIQGQPLPDARSAPAASAPAKGAGNSAVPEPVARPGGLSPREWEVLNLLAAGLSNRGIGAALTLSARTVERHIANIYAKIGAHGRADATAFALRPSSLPPTPRG